MRVNLQVSKDDAVYYGGPIASTVLPSTLLIDYIRVHAEALTAPRSARTAAGTPRAVPGGRRTAGSRAQTTA